MKWIRFSKHGIYNIFPLKDLVNVKIELIKEYEYEVGFSFKNYKGICIKMDRTDKEDFIANFEYFLRTSDNMIFEV